MYKTAEEIAEEVLMKVAQKHMQKTSSPNARKVLDMYISKAKKGAGNVDDYFRNTRKVEDAFPRVSGLIDKNREVLTKQMGGVTPDDAIMSAGRAQYGASAFDDFLRRAREGLLDFA